MSRGSITALLALVAYGCSNAEPSQIGVSEAFRIRDAQFVRATLPGKAPSIGSATAAMGAPVSSSAPSITSLASLNNVVVQGQGGKQFTGRTSKNGAAVALALRGVSHGYWVLPAGSIDPQMNEPTWTVTSDFDTGISAGRHELRVVAIDEHGVAGQQLALTLCVDGKVPDNLRVCDPKRPLPKAVVSLSWDANADLDLQVVAPDGQVIDQRHPTTVLPDSAGMLPADVGVIDRDSNANCSIDGIRTENLVWNEVLPTGVYGIYVNLTDSCKQPAARFRVEVYTAVPDNKSGERLKQWFARGGELLEPSANGGSGRGLFVTEFEF